MVRVVQSAHHDQLSHVVHAAMLSLPCLLHQCAWMRLKPQGGPRRLGGKLSMHQSWLT